MKSNFGVKILSLILTMIMVVSSLCIPASAATTKSILWSEYVRGGEGVGYHDSGDAGVIEYSSTTGICLRPTEWVKYDVSGLDAGVYYLTVLAGNTGEFGISVEINGETVINKQIAPPTGSYGILKEHTYGEVKLDGGKFELKIIGTAGAAYYKNIILEEKNEKIRKIAFENENKPYFQTYIPSMIQAENFDYGLPGVAYLDLDEQNQGGAYRKNTQVDISENKEKGYEISLSANEWINYTFFSDFTTNYDLYMSASDLYETAALRVYIDGLEVCERLAQETFKMEKREVFLKTIKIPAGKHVLTLKGLDGELKIDYMRFKSTQKQGIDITDKENLRTWEESQDYNPDDYEDLFIAETQNEVMKELYVSAGGSDSNQGTKEKPFKTIKRAKEEVRKFNKKMTGDIVVNLSGEFFIDETLTFEALDSGSNGFDVIYRGDENTVIHGGEKVTGWEKVNNTNFYKARLSSDKPFRQFYIGENRGVKARSKWLYYAKAIYDDENVKMKHAQDGFVLNGCDFPQMFSRPEEIEFVWLPSWKNVRITAEKMVKNEEGDIVVTFPQPYYDATFADPSPTVKTPYYLENAVEFFDEPGEWYFDKETQYLYYYPMEYEDMSVADCYVPRTEFLIDVKGTKENPVNNIVFDGIDFKYGAWEEPTKCGFSTVQADCLVSPDYVDPLDTSGSYPKKIVPAQIQINNSKNVDVRNCTLKHLGSNGVSVSRGSSYCKIDGNVFDDVSGTAVTVSDWNLTQTSPIEDYARNITISNNLIRRSAVEYMTPLITAYHANKTLITNNDILDAPYTGISVGWGWGKQLSLNYGNAVKNNRIENVLYKLKDGGHIYTLDANKGGVISGNYMIKADEGKGGIYHDNGSSYWTSKNNVFEEVPKNFKITWSNIQSNVAYDNYSETPNLVTYESQNAIDDPIGKTNGEWPDAAKEIIEKAGLREEYKDLLTEYNALENLRNSELKRLPYDDAAGINKMAGDHIYGEPGVAFNEILNYGHGRNKKGEPDVEDTYDGTGHLYIMSTQQGEWTKYEFDVPEEGYYKIIPKLAVVGKTGISIELDDKLIVDKKPLDPNSNNYSVFSDYDCGTHYFTKGKHIIKVVHASGNFGFWSIRLLKEGTPDRIVKNDGFVKEYMDAVLAK